VFCCSTSAFCNMIICSIEVLHLAVRLVVLVCRFDALFYPSLTLDVLPCYDVLLCADTCWPACWTCASLGQAAVAGRTRVCGCTHSTMTACLADQRAQDVCFSTPMQRWIVNANLTTSSESTSINSQWICRLMFEQFALISPDLSQFRFLWTL